MNKTVEYVNFNKICRLCLRKTDIVPLTTLVTKHILNHQNISFVEMLEAHVNFKISKDDMPQNVCQSCITQLFQSYHFFEVCVLSNNILVDILRKNSKELITIDLVEENSDGELTEKNTFTPDVEDNRNGFISLINTIDLQEVNSENVVLEECKSELDINNGLSSTCDEEIIIKIEDDKAPTSPNKNVIDEQKYIKSPIVDEHNYSVDAGYSNKNVNLKKILLKKFNIRKKERVEKPKMSAKRRVIKKTTVIKKTCFNCSICKETLPTFVDVINHFDKMHEDTSRCIICDTYYRNNPTKMLKYHMNTHRQKDTRFDCRKCKEYFLTKEEMAEHYENEGHKADPLACKICNKKFPSKIHLSQHRFFHTGERTYQCSMCGQCFKYTGGLSKHMWVIHKGFRVLCSICGKVFRCKETMTKHIQAVHEGKKLVYASWRRSKQVKQKKKRNPSVADQSTRCRYCDEEFRSAGGRKRHELRKHDVVHDYVCPRCSQVFSSSEERSDHMDNVHYKYKCFDCNRGFAREDVYKYHVESHKIPRHFKCTQCDLEFKKKSVLKIHMNIHTGAKPYKCDKCDKSFRQYAHVRSHQFQHTRKKPFECHLCMKTYASRLLLNTHLNVHSGKKPFVCDLCGKAYTDRGTLRKHIIRVHGGLGKAIIKDNVVDVDTGTVEVESIENKEKY